VVWPDDFIRDKMAKLAGEAKPADEALPLRTHNTPGLPALTKAESGAVELALKAVAVFRKNFEFWTAIGKGLKALHNKAEEIGGKATYDRLREREGLGKEVISKSRSSRLIAIIDNLPAVEAWREDDLDDKQRFNWASPEAVHSHCPLFAKEKPEPESPIERALKRMIKVMKDATSDDRAHVMERLATEWNASSAPAKNRRRRRRKPAALSTFRPGANAGLF
jgi:hypothetical protein